MITTTSHLRRSVMIAMSMMAALFIIAAGINVYTWARGQHQLRTIGQPSFNSLPMEELKDGLIVTGAIDMTMGSYAWETKTSDTDSETNLYYLIPIYDIDSDGYYVFQYFIGYKAATEIVSTMEKIDEQTWNETATPIELTVENGIIHKLNASLNGYLMEWVDDPGFYEGGSFIDWCSQYAILGTDDRDLIMSKIVPYWIEETDTAGTDLTVTWVFLGFTTVFLFIILLMWIFSKRPDRDIDVPVEDILNLLP